MYQFPPPLSINLSGLATPEALGVQGLAHRIRLADERAGPDRQPIQPAAIGAGGVDGVLGIDPFEGMGPGAETVRLLLPVRLSADPRLVLRVDIELQVIAGFGRNLSRRHCETYPSSHDDDCATGSLPTVTTRRLALRMLIRLRPICDIELRHLIPTTWLPRISTYPDVP